MKKLAQIILVLIPALIVLASGATASAQTIPHVTSTFKTPGNQTPAQAGLRQIATVAGTPVYGSVDFVPFDSSGNRATRVVCGTTTYLPQPVRAWIKSDGTLVDNVTAAAGVDLVPTIGCTPTGLVMRATIYLSPTPDGLVPSVTWIEQKQLPQSTPVDWSSLAIAGITALNYTGYSMVEDEGSPLALRNTLNFIGNGVTCADNSGAQRTDCTITGGGGGGAEMRVNGTDTSSQTIINFQDSGTVAFTNPSAGNVQAAVKSASITDSLLSGLVGLAHGGTNANLSATGGAGQYLKQSSSGAAVTVGAIAAGDLPAHDASLITSGTFAKARLPGTTVYTDQANTFGAFAQQFQAGGNFKLTDTTDTTKIAQLDLSSIATGTTRTVNVPNANSTTAQSFSAPANQFLTAMSAQGVFSAAQPAFSNLSGSISLAQIVLTTRGDLLTVNSTPALARLAIGGSNLYPKSNGTDVVYSTLAAAGVGSCGANNWINANNADAAPGCSQPGFSNLSGTVSSAQDPHALLSAFHTDTTAHAVLRGDVIAGIGASPAWTAVAKGGTNAYPKWNASGDVIASTLAAAGVGSCGANNWVNANNADATPGCSQPAFSNLSGSIALGQTPLTTNGDLLSVSGGALARVAAAGGQDFFLQGASAAAPAWGALPNCSNGTTDKLLYSTATHLLSCGTDQTGAGGSGITTLNTLTATTQTFAKTDDTNVTLGISSASSTHTFALGWTGTLAKARQNGATVYNDQANTWSTGAQDFSAATSLMIPKGAGAAPTTSGLVAYDTTGNRYKAGVNGAAYNLITSTNIGVVGQVALSNADGSQTFADPIVSYNYVNLFTTVAATGTATSAVTRVSTFSQSGPIIATWAGITGAPSGCTLQINSADSLGNLVANGGPVSVTPANGTTATLFTPSNSLPSSSQMQVVYACGTYPTGGTLSLDFVPEITVYEPLVETNTLPFRQTGAGGYIRQDSNATIAKETGGNLASIKTDVDKIPSLGQALAAASTPVVLPAAQITTLTPPAAITNYALETGGNLATLAGGVTSSVYQENVKQVGGAAIGAAATPGDATAGLNAAPIFNFGMLFNGSSYDRLREAVNALNSTGTGLPAAQIVGQFDDTSPTAITENQFGNLRMSANRNLYGTIRDAAGNERGANVDANNNLQVSQPTAANFNATVLGGLADNGAAAGTNREAALPGIYQNNYLNGTAATQGRNAAESVGTDGLLWTANLPALRPASYHASGQVASAATATDIATMAGNATNTVVITKIQVSCTQTTAGIVTLSVLKRSSADTAGTSAAMTVVPDDSNYAAGSSAPKVWTANPTKGTLVGTIDTYKLGCMAAATASPNDVYILNLRQKPIVLRGTAQEVEINLGAPVDGTGTTVTGGSFDATFEWIETTTITP